MRARVCVHAQCHISVCVVQNALMLHTQSSTYALTHTVKYVCSHTHSQVRMLSHTQSSTYALTHTVKYVCSHTHSQVRMLSHTQSSTYALTHTVKYVCSHTHSQVHMLSHIQYVHMYIRSIIQYRTTSLQVIVHYIRTCSKKNITVFLDLPVPFALSHSFKLSFRQSCICM